MSKHNPKNRHFKLIWKPTFVCLHVLVLHACKIQTYSLPAPDARLSGTAWKTYPAETAALKHQIASRPDSAPEQVTAGGLPAIQQDWWNVFKDPVLDKLERQALSENRNLKVSLYRIQESRANASVLRANLFPQIYIDPNFSRTKYSAHRPNTISGSDLPQFAISNYILPFDASYEVDIWGKFKQGIAAGNAALRASEADKSVVELSLTSDVAVNYLTLRQLDRQMQVYEKTLEARHTGLAINQSLYKAGLITQQDVAQAEIELATVESGLLDVRRNRSTAENNLAELCGTSAAGFGLDTNGAEIAIPAIPLQVPAELLRRRPDVAEFYANLKASEAQREVANTAYLPSLKVGAQYGLLSAKPEKLFQQNSATWTVNAGIAVPIFTGGKTSGSISAAEARVNQARMQYEQQLLKAAHETQEAINQLKRRAEQVTILKRTF